MCACPFLQRRVCADISAFTRHTAGHNPFFERISRKLRHILTALWMYYFLKEQYNPAT